MIPTNLSNVPTQRPINSIWSDRVEYAPNDPLAQILAVSTSLNSSAAGTRFTLTLEDAAGKILDTREVLTNDAEKTYLVAFKMDVGQLSPGSYLLRGAIQLPDGSAPSALIPGTFSVRAEPRTVGSLPAEGVPIITHPTGIPGETSVPISFGAPLPFGAVDSSESLVVLEDGKPITTQSRPLSLWGPEPNISVRWMGISFVARYQDGKPRDYRLAKAAPFAAAPIVTVQDSGDWIQLDTGSMEFQLNKRAFRGPENVVLKSGEKRVALANRPTVGGYVVDQNGVRYDAAADQEVEVRVEETGPVRAAISFRGWYRNSEKPTEPLCRFIIRIYAYAGMNRIDVSQRTIIAFDTTTQKLADVGFSMPAVDVASAPAETSPGFIGKLKGLISQKSEKGASPLTWQVGIDGQVQSGAFAKGQSVFFTQAKPDAVWLNQLDGEPAGRRSDGWLAVSSGVTANGFLRDVWQKFPKEISSDGQTLSFHTWPKHGRAFFGEAEQITRENIHRNLFAHHGPLLDLQLPEAYYNQIQEWQKTSPWDRENTIPIGYRSKADGVSMSSEFGVDYSIGKPAPAALASQAAVGMQAPTAITNPQWNVATQVMPAIQAAGDPRWKAADEAIESYVKGIQNLAAAGNIYGMWIYGNTNNNWDTKLKVPLLHRVWQNSHYGHVSFPWKYYFRSANPLFLDYARAQTGNLMDIGIVYATVPEVSSQYAGKAVGRLYHAKGWLPWGARLRTEFRTDSDLGLLQHWTNPKAFLERYLMEVNLEAKDTFQVWYEALFNGYQYRAKYGVGRELTNSISELVDIYQTFWDPRLVGYLRPMADSALGTPFRNYLNQLGFALFNRTWPIRYYDFARDPKVIVSATEALPNDNYGPYGMALSAFLYQYDHHPERLARLLNTTQNFGHSIYRQEGDPLDYYAGYASAVNTRTLDEIPYVLDVLSAQSPADLKAAESGGEPSDSFYPASATRVKVTEGGEAALLLALNPDGRAFKVRFESRMGVDMLPGLARILGPNGDVLQTVRLHDKEADGKPRQLRYLGGGAKVVDIPAGLPGVYRIQLFGHFPVYKSAMTDLPDEIAMLRPSSMGVDGVIFAPGAKNLKLNFKVGAPQGTAVPAYAEVKDLIGHQTHGTSLLYGSTRQSWEAFISGGPEGVKARVMGPSLSWEPANQPVFYAVKESSFAPVLNALPEMPKAPAVDASQPAPSPAAAPVAAPAPAGAD